MFYFISAFFYNVVVSWSIWYAAATLLGMDNGYCYLNRFISLSLWSWILDISSDYVNRTHTIQYY